MSTRSVFLVTGANRGLGRCLVRELAQRGHELVVVCRNAETGGRAVASLPKDRVHLILADLTASPEQLVDSFTRQLELVPKIDVLFNNAGVFELAEEEEFTALSATRIAEMVAVNALGLALVIKSAMAWLTPGSLIVNVLSDMAFPQNWNGTYPIYRATKAFAWSLSVNLARSPRLAGIKVIGLDPGWMRTDMGGTDAPDDPEMVARYALDLVTGAAPLANGAIYRYGSVEIPA